MSLDKASSLEILTDEVALCGRIDEWIQQHLVLILKYANRSDGIWKEIVSFTNVAQFEGCEGLTEC